MYSGPTTHKRSKGERVGIIPYGCRLAADGVALLPIEPEQIVIRDILALRAAGRSFRWIAEELTRHGVPAKKGGAAWTHPAVASVVKRVTASR